MYDDAKAAQYEQTEARERPRIAGSIDSVSQAMERLELMTERFEKQLGDVLRPNMEIRGERSDLDVVREQRSPIAMQMESLSIRVTNCADHLALLLERLEV